MSKFTLGQRQFPTLGLWSQQPKYNVGPTLSCYLGPRLLYHYYESPPPFYNFIRTSKKKKKDQRTNGSVNAHLISGPHISTKYTKPKKGQEMTLTFNTYFVHLLNLLSASTNFQATGCNSFLNIHRFLIKKPRKGTNFDLAVK